MLQHRKLPPRHSNCRHRHQLAVGYAAQLLPIMHFKRMGDHMLALTRHGA